MRESAFLFMRIVLSICKYKGTKTSISQIVFSHKISPTMIHIHKAEESRRDKLLLEGLEYRARRPEQRKEKRRGKSLASLKKGIGKEEEG